jgi:O-antigen ligase
MRLNNIFLGIFVLLGLASLIFDYKSWDISNFWKSWPVFSFFILAVFGSFYGAELWEGFKYLERYWSFILVPFVIMGEKDKYSERRKQIFMALVWGSLATLIICYGNVIYEMVTRNEPLHYFFRWRHVNHRFTNIADIHPTYLGVFIVTAIIFLIHHKGDRPYLRYATILFLLIGLFQLASRVALLMLLVLVGYFLLMRIAKYRFQSIFILLGLILCLVVFNKIGSSYLKQRLFTKEAIVDDKRFERWDASYQIFKENPFMGVGFAKIEEMRNQKYIDFGFDEAARNDLNAHNQFLELLSRNGAIGGFVYVCSLGFLLLLSMYRRDYLFSLIFFAFILANVTESMLVRIKGIEFFAVFATLFLCGVNPKRLEKE